MLKFIMKILLPDYFEYQKEIKKQIKTLEKEVMNDER